MEMTESFHISLEMWGGIFCAIAAFIIWLGKKGEKEKTVFWMEFTTALLLWMDSMAWALRGSTGSASYVGVRVANFAVFICTFSLAMEYTKYIVELLDGKSDFPVYTWLWAGCMLNLTGIAMVLTNLFTNTYYYIDQQNYYHRTDSYEMLVIVGGVSIAFNMVLLIFHYGKIEKDVFWVSMSYPVLIIASGLFQTFHYGIALMNMAIAASMLMIFMVWQIRQNREQLGLRNELLLKEKKMAEIQQDIMLSQIQPHFLYNSLSAIAMLCEKEPSQAKKATVAFADYLRGNMDALTQKDLIPFEKELLHIENYLQLEQIRFGDELEVIYDIETVEFKVPVLSVQPLVENAVKHGIRRKGIVVIHTQENPEDFEIRIMDDGVGFDPKKAKAIRKEPNRSHVGMENVKRRLKELCQGSVEYESKPGEGTTVILRIPKKGQDV